MRLQRELGLAGAVMMGLSAMVGTGIFVSIGVATAIAGPAAILAVAIAAGVAACNGLSSAQLAAGHAASGGTYEYGYRYLTPAMGFTAGWMFLVAKSASAATAALGFAGYLLHTLGYSQTCLVPVALAAVVLFTAVVLGGIRRSNAANILVVAITLLALLLFVIAGAPDMRAQHFAPFFAETPDGEASFAALFHASALMFVAYAGYARIATLGEEVTDPQRTIPRAIIVTMLVTMILYMAVAAVGIGVAGAGGLQGAAAAAAAPLVVISQEFTFGLADEIVAVGAITAMLGVLLNLILGLSRVLLAMGRRRDMPAAFAHLDPSGTTPDCAVLAAGVVIGALVLIGDIKATWSFSAFAVLIYYALTNLAALRLPPQQRLYPRWVAGVGLLTCLFLVVWIGAATWLAGLGLLLIGLLWHKAAQRRPRVRNGTA